MNDLSVRRDMARLTRRSLFTGALAAIAGGGAWKWLRTRRPDEGEPWPLRLALEANEELTRDYFRSTRAARTFPVAAAQPGRPNGDVGLDDEVDDTWRLRCNDLELPIDAVRALPRTEMVTELKCIEGWSRVHHWAGVRFRDFVARYAPEELSAGNYVSLETPDGAYYVGLDSASALHPQTLLAYEMNGRPLTREHGAPLRLVIPVKYGVKNLKRIGKIEFRSNRPPDYWTERGYDWYAGF